MNILVRYDVESWAFGKRAAAYVKHPPSGWVVEMSREPRPGRYDGVLMLDCTGSAKQHYNENPGVKVVRMIGSHAWTREFDADDWTTRGCNHNRRRGSLHRIIGDGESLAVYNSQQQAALGEQYTVTLAPYGVDCEVFRPAERPQREKLRVGWCYQVNGGLNSFKGLSEVLVPLIAAVGDSVEWDVLTPEASSCMGNDELVRWYQGLDVFLCTSSAEGGPQGPFEAAACGCAVVSTDVGQVSDWGTLRANGLIVPTYRNASEAAATVREMAGVIRWLGEESLEIGDVLCEDVRRNWSAAMLCPRQLEAMFGVVE